MKNELVTMFIGIIDVCEMEHYSPSSVTNNMNSIFEDAMNTIIAIENSLKIVIRNLQRAYYCS